MVMLVVMLVVMAPGTAGVALGLELPAESLLDLFHLVFHFGLDLLASSFEFLENFLLLVLHLLKDFVPDELSLLFGHGTGRF
jgi:uncharacterized protein YqgC (DUF456 family)